MTKMNWDKANQYDRYRRHRPRRPIGKSPRATDKQILVIWKHRMVESIPADLTISGAREINSAFAAKNWAKTDEPA